MNCRSKVSSSVLGSRIQTAVTREPRALDGGRRDAAIAARHVDAVLPGLGGILVRARGKVEPHERDAEEAGEGLSEGVADGPNEALHIGLTDDG